MESGQIIATPHDLGPQKVGKKGNSPYFGETYRLVKYNNLARMEWSGEELITTDI